MTNRREKTYAESGQGDAILKEDAVEGDKTPTEATQDRVVLKETADSAGVIEEAPRGTPADKVPPRVTTAIAGGDSVGFQRLTVPRSDSHPIEVLSSDSWERDRSARIERSTVANQDVHSAQDLKALPRLPLQLMRVSVCAAAIALFCYLARLSSLSADLWMHLPMQIYWTFCLYRISQVMAFRNKSKPPLTAAELAVLSVVSLICMPSFANFHFFSRWFDPTFLVWTATQVYWPIKFGMCIDRHERTDKVPWRSALALAAGCNAYLLAGIFIPLILGVPWLFNPLWLITNLWCISYLRSKVADKISQANRTSARERKIVAGNDLVIRYRAFSGIERWIQQRFSQQSLTKGLRLAFMWLVMPLFMLGSIIILNFFVLNPIAANSQAGASDAMLRASTVGNGFFMLLFISLLTGASAVGAWIYNRQPTHIGLSPKGLRFLWRHRFSTKDGDYTGWNQIRHISLTRPAGKTSPQDERLTFDCGGDKKLELKMGCIDAVEEKEAILKSIQKYAPDVSRDSNVLQALQPPADYSYTELWLQALSAPPKRQRLQPLISGALLKDENYKIMHSLGVGGQGQAYLALDKRINETVVLKEFILPVYVDVNVRRNALEQFENEARILRQLDHPQIVKLVDFFIEDHRAYLVLEHIQGASLQEIVKSRGKLSQDQVCTLSAQMCEILEYLHSVSPPVVHRDFTPDNLILNVDGTLKLIDFNVAKQVVESTTSGTVVGKHAYLPPEQFRGMPVTQSDIYAMGATLHFLLTGAEPEPIAVSHPQQVCPEVSDALNAIVERATALKVENRYNSISELYSDLNAMANKPKRPA